MKLELCPIVGNEHPTLPPYTFARTGTDKSEWYKAVSEANEFGISLQEIQKDLTYCFIAGYQVIGEDKRIIATNCLANRDGFLNVLYLWVAEPYRRQHIGENLVNLAILRAKKNGYYNLYASVQDIKTPAIELFKKLNFKEIKHEDPNLGRPLQSTYL